MKQKSPRFSGGECQALTPHTREGGIMLLTNTPWGLPQHQHLIAPGIVRVETAGHGGYWLSPVRWDALVTELPFIEPWAGAPWLEEDCDCSAIILTRPDLFAESTVADARRMVLAMDGWESVSEWYHLFAEWVRTRYPEAE